MIAKSVILSCAPERAFVLFTEEAGLWWPAARRHSKDANSIIRMEAGGRFYERSSDGHEVDLVIEADGKSYPVEIKLSSTLREGHWKGIETWRKVSGESSAEAFLVSSSPITGEVSKGIWNVHWSRL